MISFQTFPFAIRTLHAILFSQHRIRYCLERIGSPVLCRKAKSFSRARLQINIIIMANDVRKIQYGSVISDKVIPDNGVQAELLHQKVAFRYIGVEEYPHVSSSSYHELAKELINHYQTNNYKFFICDSETMPERKLSNCMGYWRRNPINSSWVQDFKRYPWLASAGNFPITSENMMRLCSCVEISSPEQLGILLEISLFRNAIFVPENMWSDDLCNLICDSLRGEPAFLSRHGYLKLMISKLKTACRFFFGYGGFDYGGAYISMVN